MASLSDDQERAAHAALLLSVHDERAFPQFVRAVQPFAYVVAFVVLENHHDAEDAASEAILKVWRTRARFDKGRAVGPWLRTIVKHCAVDLQRKKQLQVAHLKLVSSGAEEAPSGDPSPHDAAALAEVFQKVWDQLDDKERAVLEEIANNSGSNADCAARLGISSAAFNMKLFRARQHLQELLRQHGISWFD
jgi:RNA polymerase sigma-70 factor (ECF subfamily)